MTVPTVGQKVYLGNYLVNTAVYGVVMPPDTPDAMFAATFEIQGDQGTLMMDALVGSPGPAGESMFALRLQKSIVDDPADLPTNLTDTTADIGKYWMIDDLDSNGQVIGSSAYIWFGTAYRRMMMGSAGPVGPVPVITPTVELLDPDDPLLTSEVVPGGTALNPSWHLKLKAPRGPQGPASALSQCPDVDLTVPPTPGSLLGFTGEYTTGGLPKWKAVRLDEVIPQPYSVPEAAFQSFSGITKRATIGTFAVPPQTFPWTPIVWGQVNPTGLELDENPILVGAEVRLGDPVTGTLIGRGFGNSGGNVTIVPHYSSGTTPNTAITPENGLAVVPPAHTDPLGTVYINLYNEGLAGVYQFNPKDAQLFIMVQPVSAAP